MNINLRENLALQYKNPAQRIRIISERWVKDEIYCPNCFASLENYKPNTPVRDFYCKKCNEKFELKSKKNHFGYKITDGSYSKIEERLSKDEFPNFFFLNYEDNYQVNNFFVVPKQFFSLTIIEKRKPLSSKAKRSGWIGCKILIGNIPLIGKIYYIKNKIVVTKEEVKNQWRKTLFLRENDIELRGWTLDVMNCIDKLNKTKFSLKDIYEFEYYFKQNHPNNKHIKDKIRQQLQFLRDKGYLKFLGNGEYERK